MNDLDKLKIAFLLCFLCTLLAFSSCGENGGYSVMQDGEEPITLRYYTIGNPDLDLDIVNQELNSLLLKKLNLTISYHKLPWEEYGSRLSTMISSGADFDIAFAAGIDQGDFSTNAKKGAWLCLDPYLDTIGKEMYQAVNPLYWEGVRINGQIYGVPTNKEIAVPLMFLYPQSLVDKYQIDISKYQTITSLEPILEQIHRYEPDYLCWDMDASAHNFFAIDGYEYILSPTVPLMLKSADPSRTLVNIFETEECRQMLAAIRRCYQAGYINSDAALQESSSLKPNEKVFLKISEGGPYSDVLWSHDRQYKVVTQQVSDLVVTTESTRGSIMVVNSNTKHPEASVQFLNCINTDSEVRNLINFGIEGLHYRLNEDGQVEKLSAGYAGVQYTQGNWFLLKTVVGEPLDKWKEFTQFNNSCYRSEILGFTPQIDSCMDEVKAVQAIWKKYYPYLMTGSVDTDYFLPQFLAELKAAGIGRIREILQFQLNHWDGK